MKLRICRLARLDRWTLNNGVDMVYSFDDFKIPLKYIINENGCHICTIDQ
jgi:hypothetical protein